MSAQSYRSQWANQRLRKKIAALYNKELIPASELTKAHKDIKDLPYAMPSIECDADKLPIAPKAFKPENLPRNKMKLHVAIVGAGCAGLFTAMIIDHLNGLVPDLKITYEIFEAASEDRLGGRLFTKKLGPGDHDYYDVGAMRFPDVKVMERTFKLFEVLGMCKNSGPNPKPGDLRKYYYEGENCPTLYNDIQKVGKVPDNNPYEITGVPAKFINEHPAEYWLDKTVEAYKKKFLKAEKEQDIEEAWKFLMKVDKFSTRQMMYNPDPKISKEISEELSKELSEDVPVFDYNTVEWIETFSVGTRWFDQAFSETVLESLDFDPKADWWCIEGGTQQVAAKMKAKLSNGNIVFNKQVTAISKVDIQDWNTDINVYFKDEQTPKTFTAVFNSATLGAMQRMDLSGLNLNYGTKAAIRSLGYSASCKVAIKFKTMWWKTKFNINKGGIGKTDLPLRVCVYPSYNVDDEGGGVLLCSYTWGQDAERMGTLISPSSPNNEDELKRVLIHNLALLHSKTKDKEDYARNYELINESYETHHAYDWYKDPYSTGAFAYFGPGQFSSMFPSLVCNTGQHVIIGECASAHHAWIVGALESAICGVYNFLFYHSGNKYAKEAMEKYDNEKIKSPFGPLPPEFDLPEGVADMDGKVLGKAMPCALAKLAVFSEMMRVEVENREDLNVLGAAPAAVSVAA